jgi:hypothetical protein
VNLKPSVLVFSAFILLLCSASAAALADGMAPAAARPEPVLAPLDKALQEIQNKNKKPPVDVKAAAPAPLVVTKTETVKTEVLPAPAAVPPVPETRVVEVQPDTSFLGLSIGMYDPFTHHKKATAFNLEWQPAVRIAGILQPIFGAMATTQSTTLGYGGIGLPLKINDHIKLLPSLSIGAYEKGKGVDLGQIAVFRIGTELAYQFDDQSRVGLNAYVLTNGDSTKRADRTEIISLAYSLPLKAFMKPEEKVMLMPAAAPVATSAPAPVSP